MIGSNTQKSKKAKKQKNRDGFTLIELMVAVGIFAIAVSLSSSLFITSLRGQQRTHAVQNLVDNVRYAMETMAKEIRMGTGFQTLSCQSNSCQFTSHMVHRDGKQVQFWLDAAENKIMFDDDTSTSGDAASITSANIEVTDLRFELIAGPTDQERIVIVMKAKTVSNLPYASSDIILQTTVSPRVL